MPYCCDDLAIFTTESEEDCPDSFVIKTQLKFYLVSKYSTIKIDFCPFCGKKL